MKQASEARYKQTAVVSETFPTLCIGYSGETLFLIASRSHLDRSKTGVSMTTGLTVLTRIPCGESRLHKHLVTVSNAALEIQYAVSPGLGFMLKQLEMLMMFAPLDWSRWWTADFVRRRTPRTFVSKTPSNTSMRLSSVIFAEAMVPALLTRMSNLP